MQNVCLLNYHYNISEFLERGVISGHHSIFYGFNILKSIILHSQLTRACTSLGNSFRHNQYRE